MPACIGAGPRRRRSRRDELLVGVLDLLSQSRMAVPVGRHMAHLEELAFSGGPCVCGGAFLPVRSVGGDRESRLGLVQDRPRGDVLGHERLLL